MTRPMAATSEREAWAVLGSIPGLGPVTFGSLLREHRTATRVLELASSELGLEQIRDGPARRPLPVEVVEGLRQAGRDRGRIIDRLTEADVSFVTLDDPTYPSRLRSIEEPPLVLYFRGDLTAASVQRSVAIV